MPQDNAAPPLRRSAAPPLRRSAAPPLRRSAAPPLRRSALLSVTSPTPPQPQQINSLQNPKSKIQNPKSKKKKTPPRLHASTPPWLLYSSIIPSIHLPLHYWVYFFTLKLKYLNVTELS
jgi:hypothetical protein